MPIVRWRRWRRDIVPRIRRLRARRGRNRVPMVVRRRRRRIMRVLLSCCRRWRRRRHRRVHRCPTHRRRARRNRARRRLLMDLTPLPILILPPLPLRHALPRALAPHGRRPAHPTLRRPSALALLLALLVRAVSLPLHIPLALTHLLRSIPLQRPSALLILLLVNRPNSHRRCRAARECHGRRRWWWRNISRRP